MGQLARDAGVALPVPTRYRQRPIAAVAAPRALLAALLTLARLVTRLCGCCGITGCWTGMCRHQRAGPAALLLV